MHEAKMVGGYPIVGKLLLRELALILLTGLVAWLGVPALVGQAPAVPLLAAGVLLGLTFAPLYALALMGGRRMPFAVLRWVGPFAWVMTFLADMLFITRLWRDGHTVAPSAAYLWIAPGLFGLLLAGLAALRTSAGGQAKGALWALYLYSLPMLVIRLLFVPLISVNSVLSAIAMQGGAIFMLGHGLLRLVAPMGPEDELSAEPLVHRRAVPDAIVGLVEGTLHRRARPFATTAGGGTDEKAISLLCQPDEVDAVLAKLADTLQGKPFAAEPGTRVGERVEVVVRPRG